jgi:hypothetical protein
MAAASAPTKQSPAPVVSSAFTGVDGMPDLVSLCADSTVQQPTA